MVFSSKKIKTVRVRDERNQKIELFFLNWFVSFKQNTPEEKKKPEEEKNRVIKPEEKKMKKN